MRRYALLSLFASALSLSHSACSGVEPTTVGDDGGSAGASGTSGGAAAGTTSGTSGSSGASSGSSGSGSSGSSGSSGTGPLTGGAAGAGTAGASAGTPTTGGDAGMGASPSAGTSNVAGGGMAGTMTAGSGGSGNAGRGGSSNGGAGAGSDASGGNAGGGTSGTGGGGSRCPTIVELFPPSGNVGSLDGRLVTTPCSPTNSDDCSGGGWIYNGTTTPCTGAGALTAEQDFAVGGEAGVMYDVTLHFYGVVEPKNYGNMVTREAGDTRPMHGPNGAMPAPWASSNGGVSYPASDYNTYEVHVFDDMGQEIRQYFINSDTAEGHWTYLVNYERTIPVVGGGRVRTKTYDRNCRMIKNCGDRSGNMSFTACSAATKQTVDISAALPAPAGLNQPGLGQAASESGQWLLIDVTKVECR